jgi:adenosine deaminase
MDDNNFYKNMPKVELHLHIEGAIPIPALWELVKKFEKAIE